MIDILTEKFRDRAIERGGLLLFAGADALHVIEEARLQRVAILGIDGFHLFRNATQPSMEDSVDFSVEGRERQNIYVAAAEFIRRHSNQGLYFEIVLAPDAAKSA